MHFEQIGCSVVKRHLAETCISNLCGELPRESARPKGLSMLRSQERSKMEPEVTAIGVPM